MALCLPARLVPAAVALLLACGSAESPDATPPVEAAPPEPIAGTYKVSGTTVETDTGSKRGVAGTVVLDVDGDAYTATFSLATTLRGDEGLQKAELVGDGEGTVSGRTLTGTANTQLIVALAPGVEGEFDQLPRRAAASVVNRSQAQVDADGSVRIEIESEPAQGEAYPSTRTTLRGRRVVGPESDAVE